MKAKIVNWVGAIIIAACAPEGARTDEEPLVDSANQAIRNGDGLPAGYAEVVALNGCTGTLITNSLVLTAKHCIYRYVAPFVAAAPVPPSAVYPAATIQATYGAQQSRASVVLWHDSLDVAVVALARAFVVGADPSGWRRAVSSQKPRVGEVLECYGYGNSAFDDSGAESGFGSLRHSSNRVSRTSGNLLHIDAQFPSRVAMGGDSGGACFRGSEIAGVVVRSNSATLAELVAGVALSPWLNGVLSLFSGGTELRDGALLRDDRGGVFVVFGGSPLLISSMAEYTQKWDNGSLRQTGRFNLPAVPKDGTLLREPSGAISIFWGGARFIVPSMSEFWALGRSTASLKPAPANSLTNMPRVPRNGVALRDRVSGEIDIIRAGKRWRIESLHTYRSSYASWRLYEVPAGGLGAIPFGGSIP